MPMAQVGNSRFCGKHCQVDWGEVVHELPKAEDHQIRIWADGFGRTGLLQLFKSS
jgi:hypothetical protein